MKTYIDNIDLINDYINKTLSEIEALAFENKLKSDSAFNTLYEEHLVLLEGIKRTQLKEQIVAARKHYSIKKWGKYLGGALSIILLSIIVYTFFFKDTKKDIIIPTIENNPTVKTIKNETILDSVKKYVLVFKRDTLVLDEEKTKRYEDIKNIDKLLLVSYFNYSSINAIKTDFPDIKNVIPINDTITFYKTYSRKILDSKINQEIANLEADNTTKPTVNTKEKIIVSTILEQTSTIVDSIKATTPETLTPELITFYNSVKKTPERITVDIEKGTTIVCKEGTKLIITPKSLVYKGTNKIVRGKINLDITEYYKLSDILLANLSTKSNTETLETGGMLFIKASKNGKELSLANTKTMSIAFPDKNKKNMQLFSGKEEQNEINWTLSKSVKPTFTRAKDSIAINSFEIIEEEEEVEDVEVALNVIERVPTYPGCENSTSNKARSECLTNNIDLLIKKNFNTDLAEDLNLTGKNRVTIFFKIDKEGKAVNIEARAPHKALADEAIRVIRLLPKMEPGKQRGIAVRVPYFIPITITLDGPTRIGTPISVKDDKVYVEFLEAKIATDSIKGQIKQNDIERYTFATSKLGWINCDRFVRMTGKKVKYKLKIKDAGSANLKLVFKDISAILPSKKYKNHFDFGTIPADKTIVLVTIKKIRDKIYLGIKETETKQITELDLNFKEVTLKELKGALMNLDKDFN